MTLSMTMPEMTAPPSAEKLVFPEDQRFVVGLAFRVTARGCSFDRAGLRPWMREDEYP